MTNQPADAQPSQSTLDLPNPSTMQPPALGIAPPASAPVSAFDFMAGMSNPSPIKDEQDTADQVTTQKSQGMSGLGLFAGMDLSNTS